MKNRLFSVLVLGLIFLMALPVSGSAESVKVSGVLSGDRIRLEDGRTVKYIGVGIPNFPIRGYEAEELQQMSLNFNRSLVDLKSVNLVYDNRRTNRQGDLLAYIYVENLFVNAEMIQNGYALVETDSKNSRYTEYFKKLLRKAKGNAVGYWKSIGKPQNPKSNIIPNLNQGKSNLKSGKIVYQQPGDPYFYPKNHPNLGPAAKPILIEDAIRKGLKPLKNSFE